MTTQTTHTPGPWEVKLTAGVRIIEVGDKSDYQIATVNPFNAADEANARLIAQAPAMLAILRAIYTAKSTSTQTLRLAADEHDDAARAILRAVEG